MAQGRIICVLGMHRSGTSAIARGLAALGVDLGDNLLPSRPDNIKGFFEDADFSQLNIELLSKLGSDWHLMASIDEAMLTGKSFRSERRKAAELISAKTSHSDVFGLKDPRMCILLPFWRSVFFELDVNASFVVAVRNPLEVAGSLAMRDGMSTAKAVTLWTKYMASAVAHTEDGKRVFVSFEKLLQSPHAQLNRIADALSLTKLGPGDEALVSYEREFLEVGLRHHRAGVRQVERSPDVPGPASRLFERLLKQSQDTAGANESKGIAAEALDWLASLDGIIEQLDQTDRMLGGAWRELEETRKQFLLANELKAAAETEKNRIAQELAATAELHRSESERLGDLVSALERNVSELRSENAGLTANREILRSEAERQVAHLEADKLQLNQLQYTVEDRARLIDVLAEDLRSARDEMSAIRSSTSWRITAPLRVASRLIGGRMGKGREKPGGRPRIAEWYWLKSQSKSR